MAPYLNGHTNGAAETQEDMSMPIAIVGMGFRGPADATSVEGLWKLVAEAREGWSKIPKERWNNDAFYHPDSNRNGTHNVAAGHFMKEDLSRFDAPFFNMTNTEAAALDPQQRLLLECTYEALENAGTPLSEVTGSKTSVFVGSFCGDYTDMLLRDPETVPMYQCTNSGHSRAILANRLSYFFNLQGPSVTIDTACSASLVALHLGCQSLRTGDAKRAVVAGANVVLSHEIMITMSMMRFMSPDGRCYTFDDRANGYARGEGVGTVILKPLKDALKDGDTIRAVIRGTGSNQDGKTPGITLPSGAAQESLIRSVYESAGVDPLETSYVEAHGTGTAAGDPLETGALSRVFGPNRSFEEPLRIGSIKTNVGHLEGASGIAGVIKTVLMLENKTLLPNRNFVNPNPRIPFHDWNLKVNTALEPWVVKGPRRASVNSFGYGGSNAHAILEDAEGYLQSRGIRGSCRTIQSLIPPELNPVIDSNANYATNGKIHGHADDRRDHHIDGDAVQNLSDERARLFLLSTYDETTGPRHAKNLAQYLRERGDKADAVFLDNLAYTLNERRTTFAWKATVSATSTAELIDILEGDVKFVKSLKAPTLGFVFTGQGAQWCGMGKELMTAYPVFEKTIDMIGAYLTSIGAPFDVKDELTKDPKDSQIGLAIYSQPLCTAVQIALVDLLSSWGIKPASVTGHSSGEIAAAYTIGALSLEDAMAVAYYRGLVSSTLQKTSKVTGAMMAVGMSEEDALLWISSLTKGRAGIACVNSPSSITVSGDVAAIDELQAVLTKGNIFARKLAVEVAYHSHHMAFVSDKYAAAISHIKIREGGKAEFFSSVTGKSETASELGPGYWVANMLGQVKFADSVRKLCLETSRTKKTTRKRAAAPGVNLLLEIGPHSALAGPIKQILQADASLKKASIGYLSALSRNVSALKTSLDLASRLVLDSYPVALSAINRPTGHERPSILADLPPYPWNHENSYWAEPRLSKVFRTRKFPRTDLLGALDRNSNPLEPRWRNHIRTSEIPWVKDHKIQSNVVYPAAGYIVMAIEAAFQRATERSMSVTGYKLRETSIGSALIIPEQSGEVEVMVSFKPHTESIRSPSDIWDEFCVFSVTDDNRWTEHCRGLVSVQTPQKSINIIDGETQAATEKSTYLDIIAKAEEECTHQVDVKKFYEDLGNLGIEYGETFANMTKARAARNSCIGNITISDTAAVMPMNFQYPFVIHPSTLDSIFHPIFVALSTEVGPMQDPAVPVSVEEIFVSQSITSQPGDELAVYASTKRKDHKYLTASMVVVDEKQPGGEPVLTISDLTCTTLARDVADEISGDVGQVAYNLKWDADIELISPRDAAGLLLDDSLPLESSNLALELEQAAFYYVTAALSTLPPDEVPNMHVHHQKLWAYMTSFTKTARDEKFALPIASWTAVEDSARARLIEKVRLSGPEGTLLCHIGQRLPEIWRKEVDPWSVATENGRLDAYFRESPRFIRNYKAAAKYLDLLGHKIPHLSVLEIGASTGEAALNILQALGGADGDIPRLKNYDYTDVTGINLEAVKGKLTPWSDLVTLKELNIEIDPLSQGFELISYDVIVAAHVLHKIKSIHKTLSNIRKLLKPGGKLIIIELTQEQLAASLIFGTLPNWWAGEEGIRHESPVASEVSWQGILSGARFTAPELVLWDSPSEAAHQSSMMVSTAIMENAVETPGVLIIVEDDQSVVATDRLVELLSELNIRVEISTFAKSSPAGKVCIVLSELTRSLLSEPSSTDFQIIKDIFINSGGVLWVTSGATVSSSNPTSNLVSGMARTVRSETGGTMIVTLDLDAEKTLPGRGVAERIFSLFRHRFSSDHGSPTKLDVEYAERNGLLMIPRLIQNSKLNKVIASSMSRPLPELQPYHQPGRPLVMNVGTPGLLDTIHFIDDERMAQELLDDSVQVEVKATGLNFKDVMMGLGQIQSERLGGECSGIVTAVGKSVEGFAIGDRVSTYGFGTFSNFYRGPASAVQKIPDDMSFEMGAALPVTYCTAYYSVYHLAKVCKGDTVLVHAATGGLGQAIIEFCQMIGAEIFATVGTLEKKALLIDLFNMPEDHIFFSRDGSFAKGVMRMTGGRGADVIMNSLAGEALRLTWNCIAPYGRFVELGARDLTVNTRLEMANFIKNPMFAAFNFVYLVREKHEVAEKVWADVMDLFRNKSLKGPSPLHVHPISQVENTLRIMQTGKHMGKLVAVAEPSEKVQTLPQDTSRNLLRSDGSYVLVGGLGGIGRAIALWMTEHGARNLIFANRSGLATKGARDLVEKLGMKGATVAVYSCDVSKSEDLATLIAETSKSMPPIRGVIQAAMVLRDNPFEKMTLEEYTAVIRPKVQGTWNLHEQLPKQMDFFLMLSSVSGVIGNATQTAYAAGSTFMDAFAVYRNSLGLPAVTLDLGVITGAGYLAENKSLAEAMKRQGFEGTNEEKLMALIQSALADPCRQGLLAQTITGLGTWRDGESLSNFDSPLFSHFRRQALEGRDSGNQGAGAGSRIRDSLRQAKTLEEAADRICAALIDKISSRSQIPVENIFSTNPMAEYGIDSLVAVEMRNWIIREMDSTVPILELLANNSLLQLSGIIAQRSRLVNFAVEV